MCNQFTPKRQPIVPIGPSIAYIPLTQGQFSRVDSYRADALCVHNWHVKWSEDSRSFYARRCQPKHERPEKVYMHAEILGLAGRKITADHIDRDTLNNQDYNLRPANQTQQNLNQRLDRRSKSGYPGVWWSSERNKWRTQLNFDGKKIMLTDSDTVAEAVVKRKNAEIKYAPQYAIRHEYNPDKPGS